MARGIETGVVWFALPLRPLLRVRALGLAALGLLALGSAALGLPSAALAAFADPEPGVVAAGRLAVAFAVVLATFRGIGIRGDGKKVYATIANRISAVW